MGSTVFVFWNASVYYVENFALQCLLLSCAYSVSDLVDVLIINYMYQVQYQGIYSQARV